MSTTYDRLVTIVTELHDSPPDRIGPQATFAGLDVDSLTMVEIGIHIERALGIALTDDELREDLTLDATARLIDAKRAR
ncbi:acyl carrier protein [Streptomyces phaeofaciens]|uniref:acyl carrier protein n=1 Tax=Streptomyces phaeofaciens TaxID=68254 RepID=UPI00368793E3